MPTIPAIHEIIPQEVIDFYLDGRYTGSLGRSNRYNHLAWSLYMRGIYSYVVTIDNDGEYPHHCGLCIIDFQQDVVKVGGIRLLQLDKELGANSSSTINDLSRTLRFWKSDLAALKPTNRTASIDFVYSLGGDVSNEQENLSKMLETYKNVTVEAIYKNCENPDADQMGMLSSVYEFLRDSFWESIGIEMDGIQADYALVSLRKDLESTAPIVGDYKKIATDPPPKQADEASNASTKPTLDMPFGTKIRLARIRNHSK